MKINKKEVKQQKSASEISDAVIHKNQSMMQLQRACLSYMLWDGSFTEDGEKIADRISRLSHECSIEEVAALAISCAEDHGLRHVPVLLMREMVKHEGRHANPSIVRETLVRIVNRADTIADVASMMLADGGKLPAQVKKGLRDCFGKFNDFQLYRYATKKNVSVRMRDVMRLVRPVPAPHMTDVFKNIAKDETPVVNTWETRLSSGEDKATVFRELMATNKLGGLAFIRNIRGMKDVGITDNELVEYGEANPGIFRGVFPHQFVTARQYAPQISGQLEKWMMQGISDGACHLPGKTLFLVDVSGSMGADIGIAGMQRIDMAAMISTIAKNMCDDSVMVITAGCDSSRTQASYEVDNTVNGFELIDFISDQSATCSKVGYGGIFLTQALTWCKNNVGDKFDRVIVYTDEQDTDHKLSPKDAPLLGKHNYIVNIGQGTRSISHGRFTTVAGISNFVMEYIATLEKSCSQQ